MLLRESSEFAEDTVDLQNIHGEALANSVVAQAPLLIALVDAALGQSDDPAQLATLRQQVEQTLGVAALYDCAAVIAMFNAVVKVADATGIPLEPYKAEISQQLRQDLNIDRFRTLP